MAWGIIVNCKVGAVGLASKYNKDGERPGIERARDLGARVEALVLRCGLDDRLDANGDDRHGSGAGHSEVLYRVACGVVRGDQSLHRALGLGRVGMLWRGGRGSCGEVYGLSGVRSVQIRSGPIGSRRGGSRRVRSRHHARAWHTRARAHTQDPARSTQVRG